MFNFLKSKKEFKLIDILDEKVKIDLANKKLYNNFLTQISEINKKENSNYFLAGRERGTGKCLYRNLLTEHNLCFVGQTRSGKSKSVHSLVYSLMKTAPENLYLFMDGKSSPDYDIFAPMPNLVAKFSSYQKSLDYKNFINNLWNIYQKRKDKLNHNLVITTLDETSVMFVYLDFDKNYLDLGTEAGKLFKMISDGKKAGLQFIMASQRYSNYDIPIVIRPFISLHFFHQMQISDAKMIKIEEAAKLKIGNYFLVVNNEKIKMSLPYLNVNEIDIALELYEKTFYYKDLTNFKEIYSQPLHRVNGPAVIIKDLKGNLIYEQYSLNNDLHRDDGPAIIYYDKENNEIIHQEMWLEGMKI